MNASDHAATGEGWDGVLTPGEEILWQGRPDPAFVIGLGQIGGDSVLEFKADNPVTINFAREYRQTKTGTRAVEIGFERLNDGHEVYRLMSNIRDRRLGDQQREALA